MNVLIAQLEAEKRAFWHRVGEVLAAEFERPLPPAPRPGATLAQGTRPV